MKLIKIYSFGKVYKQELYYELMNLDCKIFDADNEFKKNREWWVIVDKGQIVAYCGSGYVEDICHFVRAWVSPKYRGRGLQRKMINCRVRASKKRYIITYTSIENSVSANNLIRCNFKSYRPEYKWAGSGFNYWKRIK